MVIFRVHSRVGRPMARSLPLTITFNELVIVGHLKVDAVEVRSVADANSVHGLEVEILYSSKLGVGDADCVVSLQSLRERQLLRCR